MSTRTGPGRPETRGAKGVGRGRSGSSSACATTPGRFRDRRGHRGDDVGLLEAELTDRPRSPFCSCRFTWPVMKTAGVESKKQLPMPVSRLVAPGPLVAMATPGTPVMRPHRVGGEGGAPARGACSRAACCPARDDRVDQVGDHAADDLEHLRARPARAGSRRCSRRPSSGSRQDIRDRLADVLHLLSSQADAARQIEALPTDKRRCRAGLDRPVPDRVLADGREHGARVDVPFLAAPCADRPG